MRRRNHIGTEIRACYAPNYPSSVRNTYSYCGIGEGVDACGPCDRIFFRVALSPRKTCSYGSLNDVHPDPGVRKIRNSCYRW